jgi:hypothetical protein
MGGKPAEGSETQSAHNRPTRKWLLRGGVIALAILVAVGAWIATREGGDESPAASLEAAPRIVSATELSEAAADSDTPIYWAGEVAGSELELTELSEGGSQVRYLPQGTGAGGGTTSVLTVSSYPLADPSASLKGFAGRPGAIVREAGDGREVVSSKQTPTSVYFASSDNSVQVEIYDPSPARAMSLALSARVQPAP